MKEEEISTFGSYLKNGERSQRLSNTLSNSLCSKLSCSVNLRTLKKQKPWCLTNSWVSLKEKGTYFQKQDLKNCSDCSQSSRRGDTSLLNSIKKSSLSKCWSFISTCLTKKRLWNKEMNLKITRLIISYSQILTFRSMSKREMRRIWIWIWKKKLSLPKWVSWNRVWQVVLIKAAADQHFENREKEEEVQVVKVAINAVLKTLVSIVVEKAINRTNRAYWKRKTNLNRRLIKIGKNQIGCQKYSTQVKRSGHLRRKKKNWRKVRVHQQWENLTILMENQ